MSDSNTSGNQVTADLNSPQLSRQQIYDRIRQTSKDEYILSEMKRLGFWPNDSGALSLPEAIIQQQGELRRELQELLRKQRLYYDRERMLRELRKQRMKESRERQHQNKLRREEERKAKAAAWEEKKKTQILYIGEEGSAGLSKTDSDLEKLKATGLPILTDARSLAIAMGITIGELRFLSYHRKVADIHHYKRFYIPKKRGGERLISAPMPRLKKQQYWILEQILEKIPLQEYAKGFRKKHSILDNATPHTGAELVLNLDLKNFFPGVSYRRVKGLFRKLGYSEHISTLLGRICTEADTDEVLKDGMRWYVSRGERFLPQGSPCSPAITNLICRRLDRRLSTLARKNGLTYTRYADDLTFSGSGEAANKLYGLLHVIKAIIKNENFVVHPDKIRFMRKSGKQEVTGIVVNEKANVDRKKLRSFRAFLHQVEKDGWTGKQWGTARNAYAAAAGFISFVQMVSPEKAAGFQASLDRIVRLHGKPERPPVRFPQKQREPSRVHHIPVEEYMDRAARQGAADAAFPTQNDRSNTIPGQSSRPAQGGDQQSGDQDGNNDEGKKPWWKLW